MVEMEAMDGLEKIEPYKFWGEWGVVPQWKVGGEWYEKLEMRGFEKRLDFYTTTQIASRVEYWNSLTR